MRGKKKTQSKNKKRFAHEFVCFVVRKLAWNEIHLYGELFFLCNCKLVGRSSCCLGYQY